jgi:hypothetical protein
VPASYQIDVARALVTTRWWGSLTEDDVRTRYGQLRADRAFDPTFGHLADFRESADVTASSASIAEMAHASPFAPSSRRAIVASAASVYGCARMFATHCEDAGGQVLVFRDFHAAAAWVGHAADAAADDTLSGGSL